MQHKNKIIIGLTSVLVVVAIVLTIESKIVIKNNKIMEEPNFSNKSEANVASIEKDTSTFQEEENFSNDATSNASKGESSKNTVKEKVTSNSEKYIVSKISIKDEDKLEISNDEHHEESFPNKVQKDTTSIENNSIKKLGLIIKNELFSDSIPRNNNEYILNYRSVNKSQRELKESNLDKKDLNKIKNSTENLIKVENNKNKDIVSSASKSKVKGTNTVKLENNTDKKSGAFIEKAIIEKNTKLIDLGWVKYIVVTFNQGNINDYDLYVLDNESYKAIKPSKVDDSGKVVKWEIDKLGYNTVKVKNKKSGEEGTYKFSK